MNIYATPNSSIADFSAVRFHEATIVWQKS